MNEPSNRKLSPLQQHILRVILANTEAMELRLSSLPERHPERFQQPWGAPWKREGTNNERAATYLSLVRLEERGLVLRQNRVSTRVRSSKNEAPPKRTRSVTLTEAGRTIARDLSTVPLGTVELPYKIIGADGKERPAKMPPREAKESTLIRSLGQ